jgi:hypothetical protein
LSERNAWVGDGIRNKRKEKRGNKNKKQETNFKSHS